MDKGARAARLADQIRDHIARWLHEDYPGLLISVTDSKLSTNGQRITVWLTAFDESAKHAAHDAIAHPTRYQHRLHSALIRHNVPILTLRIEESIPSFSNL